jgi:ATP synthase protein I
MSQHDFRPNFTAALCLRNISQAPTFQAARDGHQGEEAELNPSDEGATAREKEIARRRDELLADARRNIGATDSTHTSTGSGAALAGVGLQFAIAILVGLFAGRWLDQKFGTAPWLLIAGLVVGATAGFYAMYKALKASDADGTPRGTGRKD